MASYRVCMNDSRPMTTPPPWEKIDDTPLVRMSALWPDVAGRERRYEVIVTVGREDRGEPLVPFDLPLAVMACWSADQVTASVVVLAERPSLAAAIAETLMPALACASGALVTVKAAR